MRKILIVDDEPYVLAVMSRMLERLGDGAYIIRDATDGQMALNIITIGQFVPDIIITDCRMPNLDGPALVAAAREIGHQCSFILMSGDADNFTRPEATEYTQNFLTKPPSLDALRGAMDRAITELIARSKARFRGTVIT